MQQHVEQQRRFGDPQPLPRHDQVAGAGDRQELGRALQQPETERLDDAHGRGSAVGQLDGHQMALGGQPRHLHALHRRRERQRAQRRVDRRARAGVRQQARSQAVAGDGGRQLGQGGDGAGGDQIEALAAGVLDHARVVQPQVRDDRGEERAALLRAFDQREGELRQGDRQRDGRQPGAGTEVGDRRTQAPHDRHRRQGVQHVVGDKLLAVGLDEAVDPVPAVELRHVRRQHAVVGIQSQRPQPAA